MSIEKHSRPGWYYVKHYPHGRKGKPERMPVEGYEKAQEIDASLKLSKHVTPAITFPKLSDVVESYLLWARGDGQSKAKLAPTSYATRERRLERYIIPFFGKYRVAELHQSLFDEYEKTVAKWTYQTDLTAISALIRWMVKRKFAKPLDWQPEQVTGEHEIKHVPHPADLLKAVDAIPKEKHRMLIMMMLLTGLRWNEASNLRWEDVDMKNGTIRVKEIVNAAQDVIYIPELLREWLNDNKKDIGLIWEGRSKVKPLRSLNRVLLVAGQTVGIKKLTTHVLRAASGTFLYEQTNDLYQVQKHLRHKEIKTTALYARMSVSRRQSSVVSIVDYMKKSCDNDELT